MYYTLMRKNIPLTTVEIDDNGQMVWADYMNCREWEMLPMEHATDANRLSVWWKNRSVPIKQGKIAEMLERKQISCPGEYLLKNLGLSLTDYYWIRPMGSSLSWEDVNLYENNFQNEMVIDPAGDDSRIYGQYNPNSSLQGALEKKWTIMDGKRYLLKGNKDNFSAESINEVIASTLHAMQGTFAFTPYRLVRIENREYDFGCISKMFTSQKKELVSAYAVVTSEKQQNDMSSYEHFIHVCGRHGMDTEKLRSSLEYQIQTDFILSGRDRHLNNVAVIRDADSLEFLNMAPIFDSGKCLFVRQEIPEKTNALLSLKTVSFAASEMKLLKYVKDRNLVDVSKLPGRNILEDLYRNDSQMSERRINDICDAYERKIELYRDFQLGKDLNRIKFAAGVRENEKKETYMVRESLSYDPHKVFF